MEPTAPEDDEVDMEDETSGPSRQYTPIENTENSVDPEIMAKLQKRRSRYI